MVWFDFGGAVSTCISPDAQISGDCWGRNADLPVLQSQFLHLHCFLSVPDLLGSECRRQCAHGWNKWAAFSIVVASHLIFMSDWNLTYWTLYINIFILHEVLQNITFLLSVKCCSRWPYYCLWSVVVCDFITVCEVLQCNSCTVSAVIQNVHVFTVTEVV